MAILKSATATITNNQFDRNDVGVFIDCEGSATPSISQNPYSAAVGDTLGIGIRWPADAALANKARLDRNAPGSSAQR